VPSGVTAYLEGIRAFIPASQLAADYVEDTRAWIGKDVRVKVITADREKNKLVLSGKAVARQEREEERSHRIAMLVPGTVVEGIVESIMPYGAFVNIGNGISGLVHISQISQRRISSVHEVLKEGQKVQAKILNTNDGKVSLSMKALSDIMEKADEEEEAEAVEYSSNENTGTSLGDLLAKLRL
jgi:small subunit ribosomal protein S1